MYSLFPQFTHRFHYAAVKVHCSLLWVLVKGTGIFTPGNFSRGLNSRKFCVSTSIHRGLYSIPLPLFFFFFFLFFFFLFIIAQETATLFVPTVLWKFNRYEPRVKFTNVLHTDYFTVSTRSHLKSICKPAPYVFTFLFSLFNVFREQRFVYIYRFKRVESLL